MHVKKVMLITAMLQHQKKTLCNCVITDMKNFDLSLENSQH